MKAWKSFKTWRKRETEINQIVRAFKRKRQIDIDAALGRGLLEEQKITGNELRLIRHDYKVHTNGIGRELARTPFSEEVTLILTRDTLVYKSHLIAIRREKKKEPNPDITSSGREFSES